MAPPPFSRHGKCFFCRTDCGGDGPAVHRRVVRHRFGRFLLATRRREACQTAVSRGLATLDCLDMGLAARFEPPVLNRAALYRARLLKTLAARFEQRVVSVTADAGFGKTVLLAQAVLENRLAPRGLDVWLSCEERDQDATELAAGLLGGLGVDDVGEIGAPERASRRVAAEVRRRAPLEVAFVLDDAHRVGAGTTGADLLSRLVAELPANGHLVLCGRRPVPAPLTRLQALGEASRLGPDDLAFTAEEAVAFAELRGAAPDLVATAGGWPAVAELTISVGHPSAVRFLWEELLAGIPAGDQRLLAGLVAIGGADAALARAAFDSADADPLATLGAVPLLARTADGWWIPHALWEPAVAG